MQLTHKERLRRAIRHEPVDRLPTQINYTGRQGEQLAAYFGVTWRDLPDRLDNHLRRLDVTYPARSTRTGRSSLTGGAPALTPRKKAISCA